MKKYITLLCLLTLVFSIQAQDIEKDLKSFSRIIASPHINVILKKGDKESIRLVSNSQLGREKMNIEVRGKTLHLYLDGARKIEKRESYTDQGFRHGVYEGVSVTAYVTYKNIDELEIRGEQELTCSDPIEADVFMLKAYGENEINLASVRTGYFKAALYGENRLSIKDGKAMEQHYKLYGTNKINTAEMKSAYTSASIFGEGNLNVHTSKEIKVNAFGEPDVTVSGGAQIHKRLVFGRVNIRRN